MSHLQTFDLPKTFKEIFELNFEKKTNKELTSEILDNRPYEAKIMLVGPWEYFIPSEITDPNIFITHGVKTELIISIFDPITKISGMIHFPIIESQLELKEETDEINNNKNEVPQNNMQLEERNITNEKKVSKKYFFFKKNDKKIEKSQEDVNQILENFYKTNIKKFFDEFSKKNQEKIKKLEEIKNSSKEKNFEYSNSNKQNILPDELENKSLIEIHFHGAENSRIFNFLLNEIHSQYSEKFNFQLKSFDFNFDKKGEEIAASNKTFAIDTENGNFYRNVTADLMKKIYYNKDFNEYSNFKENDEKFQKNFLQILENKFYCFEIAQGPQKPKTFLENCKEIISDTFNKFLRQHI